MTNLDTVDNSTHGTPTATTVSFGNIDNNGTITLASGTWDTNLYHAGGGIFVATTKVVALAPGDLVLVDQGYDSSKGTAGHLYRYTGGAASLDLAITNYTTGPWSDLGAAKYFSQPATGTTNSHQLTQGDIVEVTAGHDLTKGTPNTLYLYKGATSTTVDLASADFTDTATWTKQKSDAPAADPNANAPGSYYTIASVSGAVITLKWGQVLTQEAGVTTVGVAPETISVSDGASNVNYVLISQSKEIGINATGAVTATAGGFIFLGSPQGGVQINQIEAGAAGANPTGADVRLKAKGELTDVASVQAIGNLTFTNATVTFANVANSGTITRASGWSGYTVGQGIVIASAGTADPNANAPGTYYTIVAINSTNKVITLKGGQLLTPETNVVVKVAAFAPPVNIEGASLVIEAGPAAIGTAAAPINIEILGTGHGFTARAQDDIFVNAIGSMPIDGIYSSSAGVHLTATGSIYDLIASTFAKIQATSLEIQVYGATSTIGQGTDLQHPLHIDIVGSGTLQAIAPGSIAIDQTDGSLNVLDVLSKSGDVALGAAGFLLNAGNLVDPTKLDSGLAAGNGGANVFGNTIELNPDPIANPFWVTTAGGIGSATTSFNIISGYSGAGTLSATAGDQNVYIVQTAGNVSLMSISPGADAVAFITALSGSILNGRPDENAIVKAGKADLIASNSVGSGTLRNGLTGRIVSTVGNIEAIATSGDIWLWNKGALTVGGVVPVAASPYAMYAPNGSINIQTSSPVDVIQNNFSSNDILYQAGTAGAADDNLTVHSGITLQSTGGAVELDAGNNVTVEAGAVIQAATDILIRGFYLQPTATFLDPYLASAPAPALVSFDNLANSGTITLASGTWAALGYTVGGGIYVQSAADPNGNGANFNPNAYYTIAAINGATLTLKLGQTLTSEANVTLALAPVVAGSKVDLAGSFTAPTLTVQTGGGADDIELHPAVLAANTFVSTGAGNDLIHLYDMPNITAANSGVIDTVHLDGQDGADAYVIDTTGNTDYVVSVHDTGALD